MERRRLRTNERKRERYRGNKEVKGVRE